MRDDQVVVVHRARYDDWTLPKGKLEAGETPADAAVREVLEETGLQCALGAPLGVTQHLQNGIDKRVEWFRMEPLLDTGHRDGEADAVRWLSVPEAVALLSYETERELLGRL